jgi:hypothetical protein
VVVRPEARCAFDFDLVARPYVYREPVREPGVALTEARLLESGDNNLVITLPDALSELPVEPKQVARVFTDRCIVEHNRGELSMKEAAMAKRWNTDLCNDVVDLCLQLHGGYGYTADFLVGRAFVQARVQHLMGW